MKALTLVSIALFTSTSLFASDTVTSPKILRAAGKLVLVGEPQTHTQTMLPRASTRFADRASARASAQLASALKRIANAGGNPSANDAYVAQAGECLSELVTEAYQGSTCLANLVVGLRDLAAHQCGLTAVEVQQIRGQCGLR